MPQFIRYTLIFLSSSIILTFLSVAQYRYRNYDEMTKEISSVVASKASIASVKSLAKTAEKRDIWAVTIGRSDADKNPAVLIVGGAEADQIVGSELTLQLIKSLLQDYGSVDSITSLINSTTFYIIPRVSPDATEAFFQSPLHENKLNARPTDDDHDGAADEDGPEDLNGDGMITMMRVSDSRGEWLPHPDDPRIMKKADGSKGETGSYILLTEGFDNDKDEKWNEDGAGGVDLNRNFPHNYQFFSDGSGPYQVSEEETRAVIEFCFSHPNIALVFTFSSNDNLINPWKKEPGQGSSASGQRSGRRRMMTEEGEDYTPRIITSVLEEDEQYFSYISRQFQEITKFRSGPQSKKGEGAFSEWAYYHYGRWSFAALPWWIPEDEEKNSDTTMKKRQEPRKDRRQDEKTDEYSEQIKALKWFEGKGLMENFTGWQPIKHRDFPDKEVEIGGFRPFVLANPPAESLGTIAQKYTTFIEWLAAKLPKIQIRNVKVEPINGKMFRITADIVNNGYFPTNSSMGRRVRWSRNIKVTLGLTKDQKLTNGYASTIIDPIDGSGGRQELTWLIIGNPGETVTVTAESPTTGEVTETIRLK